MNTYTITVKREVIEWQEITIEADSLEEAQKLALEDAKGDGKNSSSFGWQFGAVVEEPQLWQEESATAASNRS